MLKKMYEKRNQKGFTLMEMLIVIAIIGILVAIAIPTFSSSLNSARASTDAANLRSAYSQAMAKLAENPDATSASATSVKMQSTGNVNITNASDTTLSVTKNQTVLVVVDTNGIATYTAQ